MTYVLEKVIQRKVCEYAEQKGMQTYKMNCERQRGFPDVLFVYENAISFYIEFKRPTGRLTALQEKTIKELKKRGQKVFVIKDVALGKALIDSIIEYSNA